MPYVWSDLHEAKVQLLGTARDADRTLPHAQVQALKDSGLLALSVPVEHGGIAAPATVIAAVLTTLFVANFTYGWITAADIDFLPKPPASAG